MQEVLFYGNGEELAVSFESAVKAREFGDIDDLSLENGDLKLYYSQSLADSRAVSSLNIRKLIDASLFDRHEQRLLCMAVALLWSSQSQRPRLPKILVKDLQFYRDLALTFFPGSFYPWHQGHAQCLELCPEKHILVVPDANPWKDHFDKDRAYWSEVLELAALLEKTPYAVYPAFIALGSANPTVDWLPRFHQQDKNLLMGADSFLHLHKWKHYEKLLANLKKIYVVPRELDFKMIEEQKKLLALQVPALEVIVLEQHPFEHLSSRQIRGEKP